MLDHGELNLPLAKRGDIDGQIDRYKAEQAKLQADAGKAMRLSSRERKARVRQLLDHIGDYNIMRLAAPLGCRKPSTARTALYRAASLNLDAWIAALEREKFPPGGCAACWAPLGKCDHSPEEWMGA